jgi:Ca2+-binding RTX toxin-like protein
MIHPLEPRLLFAVTASLDEKGALLITGTANNDVILLDLVNDAIAATINKITFSAPADEVKSIKIAGAKGNDRITVSDAVLIPTDISGGDGNDVLKGSNKGTRVFGDAGYDTLTGGAGRDLLSGGPGVDTVSYAGRTENLVISLDGKANDGVPGKPGVVAENDNIGADVEKVLGGLGNDKIVGNALNNTLQGGAGNDTLLGQAGDDLLVGGAGADLLDAGDGDDVLLAIDAANTDTLKGGLGFDSAALDSITGVKDTLLDVEDEVSVLEL